MTSNLDLYDSTWVQVVLSTLTAPERERVTVIPERDSSVLDAFSGALGIHPTALCERICVPRNWHSFLSVAGHPIEVKDECISDVYAEVSLHGAQEIWTSNPFDRTFQKDLRGRPWRLAPRSVLNALMSSQSADRTCLLIEDDSSFALVVTRFLNRANWRVVHATSISDGEAKLKACPHSFSAIICDVHLGRDGSESTFKLLQQHKRTESDEHIPILMLTSDTSTATKIKCLQNGAFMVLHKQTDPRLMIAYVERIIAKTSLAAFPEKAMA